MKLFFAKLKKLPELSDTSLTDFATSAMVEAPAWIDDGSDSEFIVGIAGALNMDHFLLAHLLGPSKLGPSVSLIRFCSYSLNIRLFSTLAQDVMLSR